LTAEDRDFGCFVVVILLVPVVVLVSTREDVLLAWVGPRTLQALASCWTKWAPFRILLLVLKGGEKALVVLLAKRTRRRQTTSLGVAKEPMVSMDLEAQCNQARMETAVCCLLNTYLPA